MYALNLASLRCVCVQLFFYHFNQCKRFSVTNKKCTIKRQKKKKWLKVINYQSKIIIDERLSECCGLDTLTGPLYLKSKPKKKKTKK